jgi:hypothetical protein
VASLIVLVASAIVLGASSFVLGASLIVLGTPPIVLAALARNAERSSRIPRTDAAALITS